MVVWDYTLLTFFSCMGNFMILTEHDWKDGEPWLFEPLLTDGDRASCCAYEEPGGRFQLGCFEGEK